MTSNIIDTIVLVTYYCKPLYKYCQITSINLNINFINFGN